MIILILNAGSSSQKSCLYSLDDPVPDTPFKPLWEANIDWLEEGKALLTVESNDLEREFELEDHDKALKTLLDTLVEGETKVLDSLSEIDAVGHRVVHGGAKYSQPTLINREVKQAIAELIPLAPSHNPANLTGIETIERLLPEVPQIAVFDTAFHSTIPEPAKVYPIPYRFYQAGIQRYGFHGISHEYCARRAAQILQQPLESLKIVVCHLGNGCSLSAIQHGKCIDTTMGFSPLEGLMMGTRCGSIDPQIVIYLLQEYNLDAEEINNILNRESGLKGVSGVSNDVRTILKAIAEGNSQAQLAYNIYLHRLRKAIAAMVASLQGLDVLVFTAGAGENQNMLREKTCASLSYLGLRLDISKNNASPVDINIATNDSSAAILVIHTQEDWAIAEKAASIVKTMMK